jgi:hypothetical protein
MNSMKIEREIPPADDSDGNGNLSDNKVDVEIEPSTKGNTLHLNLCSISLVCCTTTTK